MATPKRSTLSKATNLDSNRPVAKALFGMVVAVNLLNIDKTYPGTNFISGDNAYD